MDNNEAFEKWAKDHEYAIDDYVYALEIWQACEAHNKQRTQELEAHIEDLRKGLQDIATNTAPDYWQYKVARNLLYTTPQQSLQNLIDEVREDDAKIADAWEDISCAYKIRAKKGKPL